MKINEGKEIHRRIIVSLDCWLYILQFDRPYI